MVLFEIDDERIKKLAENTLKRAFIGEFKKIHEKLSDKAFELAAGALFAFSVRYIAHVHLENKLDPRTAGRMITDTRVEAGKPTCKIATRVFEQTPAPIEEDIHLLKELMAAYERNRTK